MLSNSGTHGDRAPESGEKLWKRGRRSQTSQSLTPFGGAACDSRLGHLSSWAAQVTAAGHRALPCAPLQAPAAQDPAHSAPAASGGGGHCPPQGGSGVCSCLAGRRPEGGGRTRPQPLGQQRGPNAGAGAASVRRCPCGLSGPGGSGGHGPRALLETRAPQGHHGLRTHVPALLLPLPLCGRKCRPVVSAFWQGWRGPQGGCR